MKLASKTSVEAAEQSVTCFDDGLRPERGVIAVDVEPGMLLARRYVVGRRLGAGGSSVVFRAWDTRLCVSVAIKVLLPALPNGERWLLRQAAREVALARSVRHPNVCAVFDLEAADGVCFLTMELARGGTLRDELGARRGGAWMRDVLQVCDGLAALHAQNIAHGDLTPRNILRMSPDRLAIADLGLARSDGDEAGALGGTPRYMAPEVALGARPDVRSDVWQLGLVLRELLGAAPDGEAAEAVRTVVASCLVLDPAARPPDVRLIAEALPRR
jgi:serine/threonine protein kinase